MVKDEELIKKDSMYCSYGDTVHYAEPPKIFRGGEGSFLSSSLKSIPVGTAYVVFTGIGAAGTVLFGIFFLSESRDIMRLMFIVLIIAGTIGLKFVGK